MPQRLTPLEVSLLALDTAHTPGHVGTVDIFDPGPDGFDYERLIALIRERIAFVPRYRQRVRGIPAQLAGPVWVDDENFDLTFHVRRSALPRPGTLAQLREFVGRVLARRLDRSRSLWEMYLVEGLEDGRFALVAKSHLCLVDGIDNVEIGQVLLDSTVRAQAIPAAGVDGDSWQPVPEPSSLELLAGALLESAQDPTMALQNVRGALASALGMAVAIGETVGGIGGALGELAADALRGQRPPADSPLAGVVSEQRRVATAVASLADLKAVRQEHQHTINDVILAMISGGVRSWLLTRGESIGSGTSLTALVPMSVTEDDGEPTSLGSQVAPHLQRLPIGEPNPLMRLHQVAYDTQAHKDSGRAVAARSLADIAGFAPTTLHALGVRTSIEVVRKQHDLVITNVPGPQVPLFAAGAELVASYPILPLSAGHLLSIGVTSYDGEVFFGLNADRDAIGDLDVLAQCLLDCLDELLDTTVRGAAVRQPTRKAPAAARRAAAKKAAARQEAARKAAGQKRAAVRNLVTRAAELGSRPAPPQAKSPAKPASQPSTSQEESTRKTAATEKPGSTRKTAATEKQGSTRKAAATGKQGSTRKAASEKAGSTKEARPKSQAASTGKTASAKSRQLAPQKSAAKKKQPPSKTSAERRTAQDRQHP
jgi:diacylglycerol O-acyltransferase